MSNSIVVTLVEKDSITYDTPLLTILSSRRIDKVVTDIVSGDAEIHFSGASGIAASASPVIYLTDMSQTVVRDAINVAVTVDCFDVTVNSREGDFKNQLTTGTYTIVADNVVEAYRDPSDASKSVLIIQESSKTNRTIYYVDEELLDLHSLIELGFIL